MPPRKKNKNEKTGAAETSAAEKGAGKKSGGKKRKQQDGVRETVESVAIAFVLAFLF